MKRLMIGLVLLTVGLALIACNTPTPAPTSTPPQPPGKVIPTGDPPKKVPPSESSKQSQVPPVGSSASSVSSASKEPTAVPTVRPSSTPRPTSTPFSTSTPRPTSTPFATWTPRPTSTPVGNVCNLQPGQSGILFSNLYDFKVLLTIGGGEWGTHDYWFEPKSKTPIQFPPGDYTATLTIPGKGNYKFSNDRIKFEAGKCYTFTTP